MNPFRQIVADDKDKNRVGAQLAMNALAELKKKAQPKEEKLQARERFIKEIPQRILDFLKDQRAMLKGQKDRKEPPDPAKFQELQE